GEHIWAGAVSQAAGHDRVRARSRQGDLDQRVQLAAAVVVLRYGAAVGILQLQVRIELAAAGPIEGDAHLLALAALERVQVAGFAEADLALHRLAQRYWALVTDEAPEATLERQAVVDGATGVDEHDGLVGAGLRRLEREADAAPATAARLLPVAVRRGDLQARGPGRVERQRDPLAGGSRHVPDVAAHAERQRAVLGLAKGQVAALPALLAPAVLHAELVLTAPVPAGRLRDERVRAVLRQHALQERVQAAAAVVVACEELPVGGHQLHERIEAAAYVARDVEDQLLAGPA